MNIEIIKRPVFSEKSDKMADPKGKAAERGRKYTFKVDIRANKIQIKQAIERLYSVSVDSVNTAIFMGKSKQRMSNGKQVQGRTGNYKKAIVTLKVGEAIDFYANI